MPKTGVCVDCGAEDVSIDENNRCKDCREEDAASDDD